MSEQTDPTWNPRGAVPCARALGITACGVLGAVGSSMPGRMMPGDANGAMSGALCCRSCRCASCLCHS